MSRVSVAELEYITRLAGETWVPAESAVLVRALDELAELRAGRGGWEPPSGWHVVPTDGTKADWLRAREAYLTASDVPAVLGMSAWKSRADIVAAKAAGGDGFTGNDRTLAGECLEDGVCRYVEAKLGHAVARVRHPGGSSLLVQHHSIPALAASPDGVVLLPDGLALLEVKVTSSGAFSKECATAQLRVQMDCVGLDRGVLAVCRGSDIRLTKVVQDPALVRRLPAVVSRFWKDVAEARKARAP